MLGWFRTPDIDGTQRDFYVRQLRDGKGSADIAAMFNSFRMMRLPDVEPSASVEAAAMA